MDVSLPSRDALKAQARRLRTGLALNGHDISHAQALEAVAHQWGARDWNTLCAQARNTPRPVYHPGQPVSGRYLGRDFTGQVKAANARGGGFWGLTLRFDAPVDVVRSPRFSALRQQVTCVVDATGRSAQKTSDGLPHMILHDHWSGA
ncbi:hypothetical protein KX928_11995 [Roseobacter sp. YSTF-M11]|uniref:Glyoxalase-related protein domain-containing protein n=1 Tax=Roseobacter insulae TaxID=2859783 RepID=A0A9X1FWU0_9RHOB|nr:glyoxalase superfamily protein [Roseobacter insulae]MBW4708505.1 hypothetical protein [Roseobacter insulae]